MNSPDQVIDQTKSETIICQAYGKITHSFTPIPVPKPHEVLVQVKASSINAADILRLTGKPFLFRLMTGLFKPGNPAMIA